MKRCLKRVLGKNRLNYDELVTVVCEVEATLNSRPLTYVSSEDFDEPLTPSHLLTGHRILDLPAFDESIDEDFNPTHDKVTKSMAHLSTILAHFWNRWRSEYLSELRATHNNQGEFNQTISIVDIVLVSNENLPRGQWKLGRVQDLIKGSDDMVRGAVIGTTTNLGKPTTINRPIQILYPLEIQSQSNHPEQLVDESTPTITPTAIPVSRPKRKAAVVADKKLKAWLPNLK